MKYKFEIPTRLAGLNEYTNSERRNRYAGNEMKQKQQTIIRVAILEQLRNLKITKPVIVHFTWIEENKKRDTDNVAFGKKFILDALVECGTIKNDNPTYVRGFTDNFEYADKSKVIVELEEIDT